MKNTKKTLSAIINSDFTYKKIRESKLLKLILLLYSFVIFVLIILSIFTFSIFSKEIIEENIDFFRFISFSTTTILTIDFFLRWYTANVKLKMGKLSYLLFPFTFVGLCLILSIILPQLAIWNNLFQWEIKVFVQFESFQFLPLFRIFLLIAYIPGFRIITNVFRKEKEVLYIVFLCIISIILVFSLLIYNFELNLDENGLKPFEKGYNKKTVMFKDFFDCFYYATITLTSIGFGDKTSITIGGKIITMIMSFLGIIILAIPTGIVASGFISQFNKEQKNKK